MRNKKLAALEADNYQDEIEEEDDDDEEYTRPSADGEGKTVTALKNEGKTKKAKGKPKLESKWYL